MEWNLIFLLGCFFRSVMSMAVHPSDLDEGTSLAALDLEKLACVPQLWLPQTQKLGRFSNCPLACKINARLSVAFRVCDSGGLMCVSVWSSVLLPARSVRARVASRVCDLVNFARVRLVCGVCVWCVPVCAWTRVYEGGVCVCSCLVRVYVGVWSGVVARSVFVTWRRIFSPDIHVAFLLFSFVSMIKASVGPKKKKPGTFHFSGRLQRSCRVFPRAPCF